MRLEECNTNWFPVSWIPSNWICFSRGFFFLFCALLLSQGGLKGEGCHGFLEKVNGRMSVLCEEDERCSCSLCVDDGKCQGQSQCEALTSVWIYQWCSAKGHWKRSEKGHDELWRMEIFTWILLHYKQLEFLNLFGQ